MMKSSSCLLSAGLVLLGPALPAAAEGDADLFQFLAEEAKVVTASRVPQTISHSPATVYVVTGEDIKAMGALTIWDALRSVPGVDVSETTAGQGEVSIRGLNGPLSNRTLVLLDGKTVLNSYFNFVQWEAIPVSLQGIDRIEIVEGPASALYGANATNGVINIITKKPEQIRGGLLSYTGGERDANLGTFLYGDKRGPVGYKLDLAFHSFHTFDNGSQIASQIKKLNAQVAYDLPDETKFGISGGGSDGETQIATGNVGLANAVGPSTFLRADADRKDTHFRAFWNHSRLVARNLAAFSDPDLDYDTVDANLDQSVDLPFDNKLSVGGNYTRNSMRSNAFSPGLLTQDLWGLFFEDQWKPLDHWTVVASGRLDRSPFTPLVFSPRGSLIFDPVPEHVFRISAGSSYRSPTLLENYFNLVQITPGAGAFGSTLDTSIIGNRSLKPERMEMYEIAHSGTFGVLKTTIALFHYKLKDIINADLPVVTFAPPFTTTNANSTFSNAGEASAWGGELGADYQIVKQVDAFANYSYERIKNYAASRDTGNPENKANAGVRGKAGPVTASLWGGWVDKTQWPVNPSSAPTSLRQLPAYGLVNAHLGYAFSGKLSGFEAAVSVFNLLQQRHYETLPFAGATAPGQYGQVIGSRWTGTASYRF